MVSTIYAFMLFVSAELMLNQYRISRITSWEMDTLNIITVSVMIIGFILSSILFIFVTGKLLKGRLAGYWSTLVWFPYFIFVIFIFATLFPITDRVENPLGGVGIMMIGAILLYPFYLANINMFSTQLAE